MRCRIRGMSAKRLSSRPTEPRLPSGGQALNPDFIGKPMNEYIIIKLSYNN
jgi:hypothetical protein